jgi:hypothetical protein
VAEAYAVLKKELPKNMPVENPGTGTFFYKRQC